jgi:hypothetical protein
MWEYDAYHSSIITAGNGGSKPTQAALTIFYNQGTQRYDLEQTLQPDEQMWVDVGKLIREQVPDKNGNVLPNTLTSGSYQLRDLTNKAIGSLFEGKVTYDKTYGHVAYGCAECCGWADAPYMYYNPIGVALGFQSGQDVWDEDLCTDNEGSILFAISPGSWTTGNGAIATASRAVLTGVSVGSTTNGASGSLTTGIGGGGGRKCPITPIKPSGDADVKPSISSVSPSRGLIGATTKSVSIAGKGLTGGHVNTPAAIQVTNITTATDTQITFDAVISSTATPGNNAGAIYVSVSGQESNKVDFFVQVPTSLSMVPGSAQNTTEKPCPGVNQCGRIVTFKYQVYDQDSPTAQPVVAVMSMWDSFAASFSPDNLNLNPTSFITTCTGLTGTNEGPCGVSTYADGTFTELSLGPCCPTCYSSGACVSGGPSNISQTWNIDGYPIVQQISEYCQKVLVNGTQIQ